MARAWRFGDFVNTDQIIPGRYNVTTDPAELARGCFVELRPEFGREVRPGDIVVAGEDFGCGSSREHAVVALQALGVGAVVAASFARIFYRNAVNRGLAVVECRQAPRIGDGDGVELALAGGVVVDRSTGERLAVLEPPPFARRIARHGGVLELVRAHGSLDTECGPGCPPEEPTPGDGGSHGGSGGD